MLTIRLQRIGKRKFPTYRFVVSEKGRDTQDKYLENLGSFNPHVENGMVLKADRIKFWLEKGAQASNTVNNILVKAGVLEGKTKKSVYLSKARKAKLEEKNKAKEATKAAAAPAPAEEAPKAEEVVAAPAEPAVAPEAPVAPETPIAG